MNDIIKSLSGISGICGLNCRIFLRGRCKAYTSEEIVQEINTMTPENRNKYIKETEILELYPGIKEAIDNV
jgi:hypothetical protein